jgi:hypothetical protein
MDTKEETDLVHLDWRPVTLTWPWDPFAWSVATFASTWPPGPQGMDADARVIWAATTAYVDAFKAAHAALDNSDMTVAEVCQAGFAARKAFQEALPEWARFHPLARWLPWASRTARGRRRLENMNRPFRARQTRSGLFIGRSPVGTFA